MTTAALVFAIVSFAGVVFLAFGYASLLALVRDLQDRLEAVAIADAPRRLERFAGRSRSFVLVTEKSCLACEQRIDDLTSYLDESADGSTVAMTVVDSTPRERPAGLPAGVDFVADPELVEQLSARVVPVGIVFDEGGTEIGRSVLGDRASLERMLRWAEGRTTEDKSDTRLVGRN